MKANELKIEKKFLLPLDIQLFSADPTDPQDPTDPIDPVTDPQDPTDPKQPTGGDPVINPEAKFTQADIDRIVKERLEREKRKRDEALEEERKKAERERLKEQEQYKELYESLQKDLEAQKAKALETRKESLLAKAGYSDEQSKTLTKLLEGETDEELTASMESLKTLFPPVTEKQYGDPSPGNGGKQIPKKKNLEDKGREAFDRLKKLGKVKGRK